MTVKPPSPFFWTPYLWMLSIIVIIIVGPPFILATPILLMITLPLGAILFLVWLAKLLVHRRADRQWLVTHDA